MTAIPFDRIRIWMFDEALPLWGEAGIDRTHGGFYEELDLKGAPTGVPFKRVRAMCRQVYVFSHAALLGWAPGAALAEYGYRYLVETAWMGPDRGWAKRLSREGAVIDPTPDLYDIAFVLFALSWRYRLSPDAEVLERMGATMDFIDRHMKDEAGEGYWHALPPEGPRLQNPHMHLLEASLAAYEACGQDRYLTRAGEIVALFKRRFFDGRTLCEYFTRDWARMEGEKGRVVEPGHQFEWAWILAQHQRLTGGSHEEEMRALIDFAETHGVDPASHATYNQVRDDGAPIDPTSRTWPNTERIKGHLGLFEAAGVDPRTPVAQSALLLLDRYFNTDPRGSWIDHFDADGRAMASVAPTSTLYHAFLAMAEILRLEPELSRL